MARRSHFVLAAVCLACGTDSGGSASASTGSSGAMTSGATTASATTSTSTSGEPSTTSVDTTDSTDAESSSGTGDTPAAEGAWGNPQIAWSLGDTQWGGDSGLLVAHRVRFPFSGTLTSVRLFTIYVEGDPGGEALYHKGDGGTFRAMLQSDDGTAEHLPSGEVLAVTDHIIGAPPMYAGSGPPAAIVGGDPGDSPFFRNFQLVESVDVEANTYYHLVVQNTTLDPTAHFVSRDDFVGGGTDRALKVPTRDPLEDQIMFRAEGSEQWQVQENNWAIGVFNFSGGRAYGNGYMEVGSVSGPDRVARYVDGDASVRQVFAAPAMTINEVAVGAMHVSGTNTMTVSLQTGGVELWSGELSDFPTGTPTGDPIGDVSPAEAEFRTATIDPPVDLEGNLPYQLEVTSVGGVHTVVGTRDGSLSYTFEQDSTVLGRAEFRDDPSGDWQGWPVRDTTVDDEFDIAFYFQRG